MEPDLISVLIPAYNVAKYLDRCLQSVVRQTYRNLEIVVVDDGSTDQTYAIAEKYAARDPRMVLLRKANEGNIAKTRNFLLEHFHGKYCVWVDSDDYIKPRYVEKLYTALVTHGADMSICGFALRWFAWPILPPLRRRTQTYTATAIVPLLLFQGHGRFALWNKMYRADALRGDRGLRFDPTLQFGEDLFFNLQYLRRAQKVVYLNEKLYAYSWRAGSEMHQKFSHKHVSFIHALLAQCVCETDPVLRHYLRGWAAVSCCGFSFLADRKRYPDVVVQMKTYANQYRHDLYKNQLAKLGLKSILWLGLKTWCRPQRHGINHHQHEITEGE